MPCHRRHRIEQIIGAFRMQNAHIKSRLDGLNVVIIANNVEIIANALCFHDVTVVIDINAVVHYCVVMGPPKILS